jgi:hypothetical protein
MLAQDNEHMLGMLDKVLVLDNLKKKDMLDKQVALFVILKYINLHHLVE